MKKNLLVFTFSLIMTPMFVGAQTYCNPAIPNRYDKEVFSAVTTTSNVTYGSNENYAGATTTLKMDIYQPTGDVDAKRPLIVFAHGGSFLGGSKTDADEVTLCTRFAKRGYVTASIDYRVIFYPINTANAEAAVWRATQDMKAAIRFFRQDAATTNTYKIDSNMVFAGGYSAGCFMAVQLAYLNKSSEVWPTIDTVALGGLEGNSGNPGYGSTVNAVLNNAGAVGDTSWIEPGDIPMVTAQGNVDGTVPYCTAVIVVGGVSLIPVSGGGSMNIRMKNLGIYNPIHTYYGQDHPADVSSTNIDTTIWMESDFLYKYMTCTPSITADYTNQPTCVLTGIDEFASSAGRINIYPVPSTDIVKVDLSQMIGSKISAELFDISGRKIESYFPNQNELSLKREGKDAGIYFLKVTTEAGKTQMAKIIWTN